MKGKIDEYSDSDEDQHDAYLERMKAEGKIREEGNDSDESDGESGEQQSPCDRSCQHVLSLEDLEFLLVAFPSLLLFRWVF